MFNPTALSGLFAQRLGFGPRLNDPYAPTAANATSWLNSQLGDPPAAGSYTDPKDVAASLAQVTLSFTGVNAAGTSLPAQAMPLTYLNAPLSTLWPLTKLSNNPLTQRPANEVKAAWYIRASQSKYQILEQMTMFWHNHFNVQATGDNRIAATFPLYDRIIRSNALGNFRALLGAVAQSTAMLIYLNQAQSDASDPNENFAREVMELHTLGAQNYLGLTTPANLVGTGYSDQDVTAAAQILTGWTLDSTGAFTFDAKIHHTGSKTILGHAIPAGGVDEGNHFLDILANHPGTAAHIAGQLYQHFIADTIPAQSPAIEAMTEAFLANATSPNQIAQTLLALIASAEFTASAGQKLKTPGEWLISLLRAVGVSFSPMATLNGLLANAGWPVFEFVTPNGLPDIAAAWMGSGSLLERWRAAYTILDVNSGILLDPLGGIFAVATTNPATHNVGIPSTAQAVNQIVQSLLGANPNQTMVATLQTYANAVKPSLTQPANLRLWLGKIVASTAAGPDFQLR